MTLADLRGRGGRGRGRPAGRRKYKRDVDYTTETSDSDGDSAPVKSEEKMDLTFDGENVIYLRFARGVDLQLLLQSEKLVPARGGGVGGGLDLDVNPMTSKTSNFRTNQ